LAENSNIDPLSHYPDHPFNIISASKELGEQLRNMTRMKLISPLRSWRPEASENRNVTNVYRISLKSLARRYLELHDEITDLDAIVSFPHNADHRLAIGQLMNSLDDPL